MAKWYNKVEETCFRSFNVIAATFYEHYDDILNFYTNRSSNAAAESFNAKIIDRYGDDSITYNEEILEKYGDYISASELGGSKLWDNIIEHLIKAIKKKILS